MLGLYWIDQDVRDNVAYDYLILADHLNTFGGKVEIALDPERLKQTIGTEFTGVNGYIVFNKRAEPAEPLAAPDTVGLYALPGLTTMMEGKAFDAQNNVGILWNRGTTVSGVLVPYQAIDITNILVRLTYRYDDTRFKNL
jgi:hypothetical protein